MFTFERFHAEHPELDGPAAKAAFEALPKELQDEAWAHVRQKFEKQTRRPKTDWHAVDARLRAVDPKTYIAKLARVDAEHSPMPCPLPDHEDDTASFNIYSKHWYCFGCNRGGRIYDFAGYLWDLPLRGEGFKQIQRQLAERFP